MRGCGRDPYLLERDLARYRERQLPARERTSDLSRGEVRFAAEALLAANRGDELPETVMERALTIAGVMARG